MDEPRNIDPANLPIPEYLVTKINHWSNRFDAIYKLKEPNFQSDIGFSSEQEENGFFDDGWGLLDELKKAMPDTEWHYKDRTDQR